MREPIRPSTAEVNLAAIERNYRAVRAHLKPTTKFLAVVKADAYGHGAVPVAQRLASAGAEWLGVAQIEEGAELRCAGITSPILLMQGVRPAEASAVVELGLSPFVYQMDVAQALSAEARKLGKDARIHVKVDTGMTRLGVQPTDFAGFLDAVAKFPGIVVEGVCSHFASSEDTAGPATLAQKKLFWEATQIAAGKLKGPFLRHLANSAAAVLDPETHFDMVRVGIMLYGEHPSAGTQRKAKLEGALRWRTSLSQIKSVPAGAGVSYGGTYRTVRESRIGVLPVGYADGFPRKLSNNAEVLVRGRRCPVVGTVCMDLVMIDLTAVTDAREGDEAILIGDQGAERISAGEVARRCDTISYEILCGIGRRVARMYSQ